ncbi:hypothetical protein CDIK_2502 [Cucumispora dikerogammari]|nr:hypothetical protein CDIK_2502 [Cucumispora dikerogammari]
MPQNRGWSERESLSNVIVPSIRSRNFSVCAALTCKGSIKFEVINRAFNSRTYSAFLESLINELEVQDKGVCVFVMDNAYVYKSSWVKTLIESKRHKLCFLLPYSPFLNLKKLLF